MLGTRKSWRDTSGGRLGSLALVGLLLAGMGLSGCTPAPATSLPPATIVASEPTVQEATAQAPPSPEMESSTGDQVATPESQTVVPSDGNTKVTILHTNDVMGEIAPCG